MIGPELLSPAGIVMAGGVTRRKWGLLSMLVDDGVGAGARTGSTGSVEGGGHHFGVASNVE